MSNPSSKGRNRTHTKRRKQRQPNHLETPDDLIFGFHAIQAALELPVTRVTEVWLADERDDSRAATLVEIARQHNLAIHKVERDVLEEMANGTRHQGAVARCKPIKELTETDLSQLLDNLSVPPFILILDGVQDPHNLGACLRTAEAAGAHAVIAPKDRASGLSPTAMKVSSGSAERLPFFQVTNLARVLRDLKEKGIWLVGTSGESEQTLFDVDLKGPLALILGSEGRGIRRLTRKHCDQVVYIPMHGSAESLNVSVAAGVCLFESARQRDL